MKQKQQKWSIQVNIKRSSTTIKTRGLPVESAVPTLRDIDTDIIKESNELESTMLEDPITTAGYTGGGTHVREAGKTQSSSCWTVGRAELDSLQHNCSNSQSRSENPRGSASKGFIGRSPLITAGTGIGAIKWWNGRRPVSTWGG